MLSRKAIDDFKKIYQEEFGKELTDSEGNAKGLELLKFFDLIYKPIPKTTKNLVKSFKS